MIMVNALVVVGENIKHNHIFMDYLERKVCEKLGHIDAMYHIDKNDTDLFATLEDIILKSKYIMIATRDAYNLVSKIISTLTEDTMVVKEGVLIPSKSIRFYHDSFLLKHHDKYINLLKVKEQEPLPPIMIALETHIGFFLVDAQSEQEQEVLENIAHVGGVRISKTTLVEGLTFVKAYGFGHAHHDSFIQAVAFGFKDKVLFGNDLSAVIAERLIESGKKVTCAESCTGGLIACEIVKNAGVSAIFDGSVVSYADEIKMKTLGVKEQTLQKHGAVSAQTVYEMLEGALSLMDAQIAIAVSGIAGPTGGSEAKPVGTVYVGAKCLDGETFVEKISLKGDRAYIQKQALFWGLKLLVLSDKKTFFNFIPKKLDN